MGGLGDRGSRRQFGDGHRGDPALLHVWSDNRRAQRKIEVAAAARRQARFEDLRRLYLDVVKVGGEVEADDAEAATSPNVFVSSSAR